MIHISLDESGDFENFNPEINAEPVFIGGILYDDCDEAGDYENEKKRLDSYFDKICKKVGVRYPEDMHENHNNKKNSDKDANFTNKASKKVKKIKKMFNNTIGEFLNKGTFDNGKIDSLPPRKGKYYTFAFLKGKKVQTEEISFLIKDEFASNLYSNMSSEIISRLIFHNPILKNIKNIRLALATRVVETNNENQFIQLGYKSNKKKQNMFYLTEAHNYRTAIAREMLACDKKNIMLDQLEVKSIEYKDKDKNTEEYVFLYLSDLICSDFCHRAVNNKKSSKQEIWLDKIYQRSNEINKPIIGSDKSCNLIWAYDEVDTFFAKAWKFYEEGDYYKALSSAFDGTKCDSVLTDFYIKNWFPYIKENIESSDNLLFFSIAAKKLRESVFVNNLTQEKLVYIFESLEKMSKNIDFKTKKEGSALIDLYDGGMAAFIHNGDLAKADKCFEEINKYVEYIPIEAYLGIRNRRVVYLCDNQKFEDARKLAEENIACHENLIQIKRGIFNVKDLNGSLNFAKALSQGAQVYSFMEDNRAEELFLAALENIAKNTPDRYITLSYLLHFYISMNNKAKYEKWAEEYFEGRRSLIEQFYYIAREGSKGDNARFSLKYALFVYIKALYIFYLKDISEELLEILANIKDNLKEINCETMKQINGHPWQIIYKYIGLILKANGLKEKGEECLEEIDKIKENFEQKDDLIQSIAEESKKCIKENNNISDFRYMHT